MVDFGCRCSLVRDRVSEASQWTVIGPPNFQKMLKRVGGRATQQDAPPSEQKEVADSVLRAA
jgi:hypothetical protein